MLAPRILTPRGRRAVAALGLACAAVAPVAAQGEDYVIGPPDVLSITVFNQSDLSGNYTIEADGSFNFPLIGRVAGAGLTLRELENELKERLADGYFRNPQVTVAVEQYRSKRIFVMGEVRSPGAYTLTGDMTLIEALALAGSTSASSSGEAVIVRSNGNDGPVLPGDPAGEVIRVNLRDLQDGLLSENVGLRDGDTIFLPRAETAYVFGEVRNPGAYAIQRETSVLQALSLAGGVTEYGATNRIKIVRMVDGEQVEIDVDLDDLVRAGDTIMVPERYF